MNEEKQGGDEETAGRFVELVQRRFDAFLELVFFTVKQQNMVCFCFVTDIDQNINGLIVSSDEFVGDSL